MSEVFGTPLAEARRRAGSLAQLARVDQLVEADGEPRGARRLRMVNGSGTEIEVHPDRALDIGQVTVGGVPIAWVRGGGIGAPAFYDPVGAGWLRTFGGGLVTTCGLDTFGPPSRDEGREFGQHGRISAAPARLLTASAEDGVLVVEGIARQSALHAEDLTVRRRISTPVGSDMFTIDDIVTNEGSTSSPHMLLYHVNVGWPLVEEGATLTIPSRHVEPRDETSATGIAHWDRIDAPAPSAPERVFLHRFDAGGRCEVTVTNPRIGLALTLAWNLDQLPLMYQWSMFRDGANVVGLEPANCAGVLGRARTRADGGLPMLEPGAQATYHLEFRLRRTP